MAGYLKDMLGWSTGTQPTTTAVTPQTLLPKNPRGYCDFRPQLFYQDLQTWHLAGSALEFRMNFSTGINQARFANDADIEAPGSEEALRSAMRNATTLVNSAQSDEDENEVTIRLSNAVTWQDTDQVEYILRSCYVTHQAVLPALAEACTRGLEGIVHTLLLAGASASAFLPSQSQQQGAIQKNALHVACENGHEACAVLLIENMHSREEIYLKPVFSDLTAFDILRRQDLGGMARRLEVHAENHLTRRRMKDE
jgi:hypothetical protein